MARVLLGISIPRKRHSPVEMFIAALQCEPDRELDGMPKVDMARKRYVIEEEDGRPRFVPGHNCKFSAQ